MIAAWWQQLGLVALGGALGASGRFVIGGWLTRVAGSGFPWGTLAINLLGCFLAGLLLVWLEGRGPSAPWWRAFLMVGVVGGLTTWSSLIVEMLLLHRASGPSWAAAYLGISLAGSLALLWLGLRLGALWRA